MYVAPLVIYPHIADTTVKSEILSYVPPRIGARKLTHIAFLALKGIWRLYTASPDYLPDGFPLSEQDLILRNGKGAILLVTEDPAQDRNVISEHFYKVVQDAKGKGKGGNQAAKFGKPNGEELTFVNTKGVQIQLEVNWSHHKAYEEARTALETTALQRRLNGTETKQSRASKRVRALALCRVAFSRLTPFLLGSHTGGSARSQILSTEEEGTTSKVQGDVRGGTGPVSRQDPCTLTFL